MTHDEIRAEAEALERLVAGRPFSATSITGRGWLSIELVIPGYEKMTAGRILWEMIKGLYRAWVGILEGKK